MLTKVSVASASSAIKLSRMPRTYIEPGHPSKYRSSIFKKPPL